MWQKVASSILVILVPIFVGPMIVMIFNLDSWPLFIYPTIWLVGLLLIWLPMLRGAAKQH